jgi:surfactin synthase thioesterase subunit
MGVFSRKKSRVDLIAIQLPGRESRFGELLLNNILDVVNANCL